jgi:hypothetical protein
MWYARLGLFTSTVALIAGFGLAELFGYVSNWLQVNNGASAWNTVWIIFALAYASVICLLIIFGLPIVLACKHGVRAIGSIILYQLFFYTLVLLILSIIVLHQSSYTPTF